MKEYKFLKVARIIFKVLAWIVLVLGVIVGLVAIITGGTLPGGAVTTPQGMPVSPGQQRAAGVVMMLMSALYFLIIYTISEIIGILLDMKASCGTKPAAPTV